MCVSPCIFGRARRPPNSTGAPHKISITGANFTAIEGERDGKNLSFTITEEFPYSLMQPPLTL